jgi:hypothetical protein
MLIKLTISFGKDRTLKFSYQLGNWPRLMINRRRILVVYCTVCKESQMVFMLKSQANMELMSLF